MNLTSLVWMVGLAASNNPIDEASDARKAIEGQFSQISKAFSTKNSKAFAAMFSDDFKAKSPLKQTITRSEILKDFDAQMKLLNTVKWTQKIKTFSLENGVAHVLFDSEMKATFKAEDGIQHDFRLVSKTKNEWIKGKSGWLVRYSESMELKSWIDGVENKMGIN